MARGVGDLTDPRVRLAPTRWWRSPRNRLAPAPAHRPRRRTAVRLPGLGSAPLAGARSCVSSGLPRADVWAAQADRTSRAPAGPLRADARSEALRPGRTIGRSTVFSGPRLAHRQAAAHEGLAVETPDGFLGVGAFAELHEGEASRAAGLTVNRHHDLGGYSHRRQVRTQLCFRGPVGKVSDEQPNRQSLPRVVGECYRAPRARRGPTASRIRSWIPFPLRTPASGLTHRRVVTPRPADNEPHARVGNPLWASTQEGGEGEYRDDREM
jgi:hypothetical protein